MQANAIMCLCLCWSPLCAVSPRGTVVSDRCEGIGHEEEDRGRRICRSRKARGLDTEFTVVLRYHLHHHHYHHHLRRRRLNSYPFIERDKSRCHQYRRPHHCSLPFRQKTSQRNALHLSAMSMRWVFPKLSTASSQLSDTLSCLSRVSCEDVDAPLGINRLQPRLYRSALLSRRDT